MNKQEIMKYNLFKNNIPPLHNLFKSSKSENSDSENSEEKDFELAIKLSKEQELLEIEEDKEEEQIQLALYKSIEEMLQKKEDKNTINLSEEVKREEEEDETYGICPITQEYMKHPMLAPSGHYYEKKAIIRWIREHHTDPMTREELNVDMLVEDHVFKKKIKKLKKMKLSKN